MYLMCFKVKNRCSPKNIFTEVLWYGKQKKVDLNWCTSKLIDIVRLSFNGNNLTKKIVLRVK